jgi:phospholipase C
VNGRSNATSAQYTQVKQDGLTGYSCLPQNDVNLPSCISPNAPFSIEQYIPASAKTCPAPGAFYAHGAPANSPGALPGGCTEDIVHRYYQEQYQINGGAQNRYVTGSDAIGLAMGYYNTTALPIYQYLHSDGAPHYAIADNFFQGAFGGSFVNHQWLIAAAAPVDATPNNAGRHSIIDSNGMPNNYPQYTATGAVKDAQLIQACGLTTTNPNYPCGSNAVNTIQPPYQPTSSSTTKLSPQTGNNIGDELTAAGVSWAWYSGGWSNADGDVGAPGWTNGTTPGTCTDTNSVANPTYPYCPNKVFQFHHQPFNYFANYAPGTPGRTHLQDEQAFIGAANASTSDCKLNAVSFVKPIGLENEHPGYTSESEGSNHLVGLLSAISNSACAKDTMVVVTYDEFGGQWDHVAPPGQGNNNGPHDVWGPGTRIPALIVSPRLSGSFVVDHTQYDTTSILATIEHRWGVAALGSRDAAVNDLSHVYTARSPFDT